MLEARAAVKGMHAYRPPLAGRIGLRLISTKARSDVRRACWPGCARWMRKPGALSGT